MMKLLSSGLVFQSYILLTTMAWDVPPANFIKEFVVEHQITSITIYMPTENVSPWITWHKRHFSKFLMNSNRKMKMAYKYPKLNGESEIQHYNNRSISDDLALFVFIPNESNLELSINDLVKLRSDHRMHNDEIWLLDVSAWTTPDHAAESIEKVPLDFDDDFYMYNNVNSLPLFMNNRLSQYVNDMFIEIWEYYEIHHTIPRKLMYYGNYTFENGLKLVSEEKWIRRKDLQGISFRVLSMPLPGFMAMTPILGDDGQFKMTGGMFPDFWHNLQDVLNFTYTLRKPPDLKYGNIKPDGSFNGMIGELEKHNADMAVAAFATTVQRSQVVDFCHTITTTYYNIVIKNPIGNPNYMAYILPFTNLSWISIGLFCIVTPIAVFLTTISGDKEQKIHEFTWIKSIILVLSAMTQRGWSISPSTSSTRVVFFSVMLCSILIYFLWEAMLVSYLAVQITALPFTGMETLLSSSNYKILVMPGSYVQTVFEFAIDPTWKAIWTERVEPYFDYYGKYLDEADGMYDMDMLLNHEVEWAIYDPNMRTKNMQRYLNCEVITIPAKYDKKQVAFAFQKDSEYLPLFNYYLKIMEEKGISNQILEKFEAPPPICEDKSGQALGLKECFTGFFPLFAGGILGFLMLFIEIFAFKILGIDISKYYEKVAVNDVSVHMCDKCGIDLNSNL